MRAISGGVIAGTPVDTGMGVYYLAQQGISAAPYPVSSDPMNQNRFQLLNPDGRREAMRMLLLRIRAEGHSHVLVYCNSLSGAVDFSALSRQEGIPVVTPLDAYRTLAQRFHRIGAIAANASGLLGIERTLVQANPELIFLGSCALPMVLSIEEEMPSRQLVQQHALAYLMRWFELNQAEAVILGCTHFSYFREALEELTQLPLLDPADAMRDLLLQQKPT